MPNFVVDESRCRKDGICSRLCPAGIIVPNATGLPVAVPERMKYCISCGHCVAFCPHEAAILEGLPMDKSEPLKKDLPFDPKTVEALFQSRRSIRSFRKKMVPKDETKLILEMIRDLPTAKNQREIRWIIVNNQEKMDLLNSLIAQDFEAYGNTQPVSEEKVMSRMLARSRKKGGDPFFRGAHQLAVAVVPSSPFALSDAAIALTYFELAALSLGIGCCWAGYFTSSAWRSADLRSALGLAEGEMVGGGQMFGYPALKPHATVPRDDFSVQWME